VDAAGRPDTTRDEGRVPVAYHRPVVHETLPPTTPVVVAIIPVGDLEGAKSRLGAVLDAEERRDLVARLADRTIRSAVGTAGFAEVLVITPDDEVRELALRAGARPLRQRSQGLNDGIREARDEAVAGGATAVAILPIDLPNVSSDALGALLSPLESAGSARLVVIVPDRHGRGTNALLLAPPDVIDVHFGGDSRAAHVAAATAAGVQVVELGGPLAIDLDTPDDLLLVETVDRDLARG
jgi:2-phospho-L-lactate guanylyltransferase